LKVTLTLVVRLANLNEIFADAKEHAMMLAIYTNIQYQRLFQSIWFLCGTIIPFWYTMFLLIPSKNVQTSMLKTRVYPVSLFNFIGYIRLIGTSWFFAQPYPLCPVF
jgi:hypothetical protein